MGEHPTPNNAIDKLIWLGFCADANRNAPPPPPINKGQNLLFRGRSDQDPTQLEFALRQKRKIADLKRMLNHLVEHQHH